MNERTVSVTCVAAVSLWVLTFLMILSGTVVAFTDHDRYLAASLALMAHGLALSAAAATVSIRYMLKKQERFLRDAFNLGRESATTAGSVRSVR